MKNFDSSDLVFFAISIGIFIFSVCACISFLPIFKTEEECVSYYIDNNGYILGKCEKYEDKLLKLNLEDIIIQENEKVD